MNTSTRRGNNTWEVNGSIGKVEFNRFIFTPEQAVSEYLKDVEAAKKASNRAKKVKIIKKKGHYVLTKKKGNAIIVVRRT